MRSFPKILVFATLVVVIHSQSEAQIFGGNPPSLKWKQINTPLSRVIIPQNLDSTGERITNIIKFISGPTRNTIGNKSIKINLVVQNQTTISNAYVGLGPFRSEFLITPLQNSFELGSLPWPDQLAIHEYRHVEQYNNFNVGFSKVMYDIFGEEGQAFANNATISNWFFEGDAVYNETNVSRQGRGRLPFFYDGYRALWKEGKNYSWMKLRSGSLKDFVPNHYPLGFLLVAYGREKYGDMFWKNVTHDAASFKGLFYPFQRAIKKYSGTDYVTFRKEALDFFKTQFSLENIKPKKTKTQTYIDETYPAYIGNDSIVFAKSGYKQIPEFVLRTGAIEKRIRISDYTIDPQFSYKNGKIVYASYRTDVRWGYRDYSDLRIIDVATGKQQALTSRTKYFSPDISADGKRVIAVEESPDAKCSLHLIDALTGKIIKIIPNPGHLFYTYPKFYSNTRIISAVRNTSGQMSLALINTADGAADFLIPFTYNVVGFPFLTGDTLYFSSSEQKNDELFAYTFSDKKIWHIRVNADKGTGKYQPSVNNDHLVYSTFTAEGYRLEEVSKKSVLFQEISPSLAGTDLSVFGISALGKTNANLLYQVPSDTFTITKYPKAFKLFNFHSIEPAASDPDYSLNLAGQNILNTFQSQIGFTYDRAEHYKRIGFSGTYGAFFPFLSAGFNYTFDRRTFYHGNKVAFNELEPFLGFNIPLDFSKGPSFTFLNFGSQYVFNQSNFQGKYKDTLGNISFGYSSNFLSFSHQNQKAVQQVFPQFAQTLSINYSAPFSKYKGFQFVANGNIYLPGLFYTHSFLINGAFLQKDTLGEINFTSGFPFSRGYAAINLYEMYKWGLDYQLPLWYPDAGFGNILYLMRARADLFYDYTRVNDFYTNRSSFSANFRSAGAEIYFDTKWWNEASISIGIRYSHLFDRDLFGGTRSNRWEIVLPANIFNQ